MFKSFSETIQKEKKMWDIYFLLITVNFISHPLVVLF